MPSATVDPAAAGARLDQFVARLLGTSVHAARRLIAEGRVIVADRVIIGDAPSRAQPCTRKGLHLAVGQHVTVERPDGLDAGAVVPAPGDPLSVLFTDAHLVVMNKPAGIPSHPLRPGEVGTLANALVARFPECAGAGDDPREAGLGHRLDNGTSGVIIAARHHDAWLSLRAALNAPTCEKTYLAEVVGRTAAQGRLEQPIGRRGRRGTQVVVGGQGRNPLPATTAWQSIADRPSSTLLRVRLHAGRAHQVRAHLAAAGHPLVGDALYGPVPEPGLAAAPRLHAESIRLLHPITGQAMFFEAPPPGWANMLAR